MSDSTSPENKLPVYALVLFALLILTGITVALSSDEADMGTAGNIIVGVIIATIKATIVVLFFMHMKYEKRWWAGFIIFPIVLVLIIIFANLPDTGLNGPAKDSEWGFTTPAEKVIPHADGGGGSGSAH